MARFRVHTPRAFCRNGLPTRRAISADEDLDYELAQHKLLSKDVRQRFRGAAARTPSPTICTAPIRATSRAAMPQSPAPATGTVNMAASAQHGRLWGEAYSVSPRGIFVRAGFGLSQARGSRRWSMSMSVISRAVTTRRSRGSSLF